MIGALGICTNTNTQINVTGEADETVKIGGFCICTKTKYTIRSGPDQTGPFY